MHVKEEISFSPFIKKIWDAKRTDGDFYASQFMLPKKWIWSNWVLIPCYREYYFEQSIAITIHSQLYQNDEFETFFYYITDTEVLY